MPQPQPSRLVRTLQALFLLVALSAVHFGWGQDPLRQDFAAQFALVVEAGEGLDGDPTDSWDDGNAGSDPYMAAGAPSLWDVMLASSRDRNGASPTLPAWQPGGMRATGPPRT